MRIFTFIILSFCFTSLFSQPVINSSIAPEIGESYTINYIDEVIFDPGPAGENLTWDYSDLPQDFEFHYEFINPTEAPGFDNFPLADCVWNFVEFDSYIYYQKTDDAIVTLGGVNGDADFLNSLLIYQDDNEAMNFPITYNTSYEYISTYDQYLFGNFFGTDTRTSNLVADAYGTLTTPNGTYEDVLRIKIEYDDSFGFNYTQYAWFDTEDFIPLLQYEVSSDPDTPPYVVITKNDNVVSSVSSIEENNIDIKHIDEQLMNEQFIVESDQVIKLVDLKIYDAQLQLIYHSQVDQLNQGKNTIDVDVNLSPAIYIVELKSNIQRVATQFYKR